MKVENESNEGYGERGLGERCQARVKAKIGKGMFGWHWCNLKRGHPGPHECVHGTFPEGEQVHIAGPDNGKLVPVFP